MNSKYFYVLSWQRPFLEIQEVFLVVLDLSIIKFNSATFVNVKQWSVDIPFDQSRLRGIDMTFLCSMCWDSNLNCLKWTSSLLEHLNIELFFIHVIFSEIVEKCSFPNSVGLNMECLTARPNSSVRRYSQNCVTPALPFLEQCESRTKGRILFSEISFSDVWISECLSACKANACVPPLLVENC